MQRLNLKHLRYFRTVVNEGSIARAAEVLSLTPQTISGQLRLLEEQVGKPLFEKVGRGLQPNATGRMVFSYADELFKVEEELNEVIAGGGRERYTSFRVGVNMVVPKLLAYRVLEPVSRMEHPVRMVCHEAPLNDLLADLAVHKLDLVIADAPVTPALNVRAFNHPLGDSSVSFFAAESMAQDLKDDFPDSLDGTPMLMPSSGSALRRALEQWFDSVGVRPSVVAEFEDRALMKAFGEAGVGVFSSPSVVRDDVTEKYRVVEIGQTDAVRESFYAISAERRVKHPAVATITAQARLGLFQ
ncbi:MAG: transcriptional activator NhaR [Gammaproteobacteria bacterium]